MADSNGSSVQRAAQARRDLLPSWLRSICVLVVPLSLATVALLATGVLKPDSFDLKLLGIAYGALSQPAALASQVFVIALGVSAVGLLRGDVWALGLASFLSIVGVAMAPSVIEFTEPGFHLRFDALIFVSLIIALERRRAGWKAVTRSNPVKQELAADAAPPNR